MKAKKYQNSALKKNIKAISVVKYVYVIGKKHKTL